MTRASRERIAGNQRCRRMAADLAALQIENNYLSDQIDRLKKEVAALRATIGRAVDAVPFLIFNGDEVPLLEALELRSATAHDGP